MKCEPRGRSFSWCVDDLFHVAGHGAQVGSIHVGVDVDDRLNVVVAYGAQFGSGHDAGQIAEDLHGRLRAPGAPVEAAPSACLRGGSSR